MRAARSSLGETRLLRARVRVFAATNRDLRDAVARGAFREDKVMPTEPSDDETLLTTGEVAKLCRVDVRTVDRWLTAGKLGCQRTPSGRVLCRKHDVLTVVARVQTSPRP